MTARFLAAAALRMLPCLGLLLLSVAGCAPPAPADPGETAQRIVDRALDAHGAHALDDVRLTFDFRDYAFEVTRRDGRFAYARTYTDSTGRVREVLTNDSLHRTIDGRWVPLDSAAYAAAETAVNSVVYFALLPYPLNDPAARKALLPPDTLRGEPYHRVAVTFTPEGGGRDYEDRFVYWFHQHRHTMDYLAYRFHVNDGGTRFREAYNVRTVGGIRFADYRNYTADPSPEPIERHGALFEADRLELLSEVNLRAVAVE